MDEKALLEAIGRMMDEKLTTERGHTSRMMDEKFAAEREHTSRMMDERFAAEREHTSRMMDEKLAATEKRIMKQARTVIETDVTQKINLLAEGHGDIVKKLRRLDVLEEKVDDIQTTVEVLKHMAVPK